MLGRIGDFELSPGTRIQLRGPNGSGKTTLLRKFLKLPVVVEIPIETEITGTAHAVWQDAFDSIIGLSTWGELDLRGLTKFGDNRAFSELSRGQLRRFVLEVAFAINPEILILDEPTEDLDSSAIQWLQSKVDEFRGAVIFTDHRGALVGEILELGPSSSRNFPSPTAAVEGEPIRLPEKFDSRSGFRFAATNVSPGLTSLTGPNGSGKSRFLRMHSGAGSYLSADARLVGYRFDVESNCSPGEYQRNVLEKLLLNRDLILLDEPETHLDEGSRIWLALRLQQLGAEGARIVIATHDQNLRGICHHILEVESCIVS